MEKKEKKKKKRQTHILVDKVKQLTIASTTDF